MQALRVSRGIALLFSRTFGTRWGWESASRPGRLYSRERPVTHCTGGWVGSRAGLNGAENLVPTGIRSWTVQPVAQSLYWLSYPAHSLKHTLHNLSSAVYRFVDILEAPGSNLLGSGSLRRVSVSFLSPYRVAGQYTYSGYSDYSTDWSIPGS